MDERKPSYLEDRRQLEHIAPIVFAFLLPFLAYWFVILLGVLAVGYALYVSPRLLRVTTRDDEKRRGFSAGKLFYALSVLALLFVFKDRLYLAASVWGILAFGDSLSNLIGRRFPLRRIPYNHQKSLGGFLAFWIPGGLAGWALLVWNSNESVSWSLLTLLFFSMITAFFCAAVETLPPVLDDNLTVAWIGGASHYLLFSVAGPIPVLEGSWRTALAVNLAAAIVARLLNWLSWRGTLLAFAFGLLIFVSTGLSGFAVMAGFLILGSVTTKLGFRHKEQLRIAQGEAGERGIANILSNGLVPLTLACVYPWVGEPLVRIAYTAAVATAALDTVATEVGQWLGKNAFDPAALRRVAVGTKGAMSVEGTVAGALAALLISCVPVAFGWLPWTAMPGILAGAICGGIFESLLAAGFQYDFTGSDEALNLLSALFGATVAAGIWLAF